MRNLLLAWIALLVLAVLLVLQAANFDVTQIGAVFQSYSPTQKLLTAGIVAAVLWVAAATIWQAETISRVSTRAHEIQERLDTFRAAAHPIDETQRGLDAAASHLLSSDPDEAIASLQQRVSEAEGRTAAQQGRNKSVDIEKRLADIRQRQQTLRDRLGDVIKERRDIEPVLNELKERQRQLDNSLSDLEQDDNRNSLFLRLEDGEKGTIKSQNRLQALLAAFETFKRLKSELGTVQTQLSPLQSNVNGIIALADETQELRDKLAAALTALDADKLAVRIEDLKKFKSDAEHKIGLLGSGYDMLEALRREVASLKERHDLLEKSVAEVEVNAAGERLDDRIKALSDRATQSRSRLFALQEALNTLGNFRSDVEKMHAEAAPLRASDSGIDAMNSLVHGQLQRLVDAVTALEKKGDVTLFAQLDALSASKAETKARIERLQNSFVELNTIRGEINSLFASINESLKKHL